MQKCAIYAEGLSFTPVSIADSFLTRFRGLMLRKSLEPSEGLLLENCSSIHCMFMRFTIDVVYLSDDYYVIAVETVKPWRLGGIHRHVQHVLEVPEGAAKALKPGDKLIRKEQ